MIVFLLIFMITISQSLKLIKKDKITLVYNYETNKAIIVNERTSNLIEQALNGNRIDFRNTFLNNDEITTLINYGIIYSDIDFYNSLLYSNKINAREPIVHLNTAYFHVTQQCNLACEYCYNKINIGKKDGLQTSLIFDILMRLKSVGVSNIVFTGGEPLLRPDIEKVLEFAKQLEFHTELLTNGTLLSNHLEIIDLADCIIISLDTFNDLHNVRIGLDIISLINVLKSIDINSRKKISLRTVLSKYNRNSWEEVKIFANENNYYFILTLYIPNNLSDCSNMLPVSELVSGCGEMNFSGSFCGATYRIIAIDSNGDVYSCQSLVMSEYKITNILSTNWFKELTKSNITNHFMQLNVNKFDHCKVCDVKYICGGGCRAIAKKVYNSTEAHLQFLCPYQRRLAEDKLISIINKYI